MTTTTKQATAVAVCTVFLNILAHEQEGICVPRNAVKREHYHKVTLPIVRNRPVHPHKTEYLE